MKRILLAIVFGLIFISAHPQTINQFADSIRIKYKIPELAFAVVTADTILELHVSGIKKINTNLEAQITDRFHIGSNTKAITSFIAAMLVAQNKIQWNTKFFDLYPELKQSSKKIYRNITLQDLLTFRAKLPAYTYTFNRPTKKEIKGNEAHQRYLLAKYFLFQQPMQPINGLTPSNADYILAGLMLEKASGKSYKQLITEFGLTENIDFGFDYPNLTDTLQTCGHDVNLKPVPAIKNYKLNWLLTAGNINVSLPGYIKFIQLQLNGLNGNAKLLSKETFNNLLYGLPVFSFGWFNKFDSLMQKNIAFNEGNAGAFITQVQIIKETTKAFIVFTNSATQETETGVTILIQELEKNYQ